MINNPQKYGMPPSDCWIMLLFTLILRLLT